MIMETHTNISKGIRAKGWFCLICLLVCNFIFSLEARADQKSDLGGEWRETGEERSVTFDCPITVSYNEFNLYIKTTSTRSDITIRIVKDGNILYEEILYSPQTATTIALDFLDPGTYRLELTNQWGGYLYGTFEK